MEENKKMFWTGWMLTILGGGFMTFDAVIHAIDPPFVAQATAQLGFPASIIMTIGLLEIILVALYFIPRTSFLGALLLTGYLGGAVATNVSAGTPFFANVLFPVYVAIVLWGGLYGRNQALRSLLWEGRT